MAARLTLLDAKFQWAVALLLCCAAPTPAQTPRPLVVHQNSYEMKAGESVQVSAPDETVAFLLKSKSLNVQLDDADATTLVAGPDRSGTQLRLAARPKTKPGTYTAKVSATSATGEQRTTTLSVTVKLRVTVPNGSARAPVVLLNGWETGFTGTCPISSSSSDTFGNLAQYLISDGVPVVYYFDNCAVDPNETVEVLGNDLATFLNTIKYDNGDQVTQIDLVGFSLGGLIARSYLAGLQPSETATPPSATLVHDLILIATPNFGSFVAGNYATTLSAQPGTQDAEMVPGSALLWNLATWNQRGDDLRGVNALAIAGNAGPYLGSLSATSQLNNASDGLVSLTSASLGFARPDTTPTQVVPYCHVDPSAFTNTIFGTFDCNAIGIANVTSTSHETGIIVRSFLSGTTVWQSTGVVSTKDPWLSTKGGIIFGMQSQTGSFVSDLTSVSWGTVALTPGGDLDTIYYTDFVSGTGAYTATSSSLGAINCGSITQPLGYTVAARCKIDTAIFSVGPLITSESGRIVAAGGTITLTGNDFQSQCNSCQVLAIPVGSTTQTALTITSWSNTAISATLPSSLTGMITIEVVAVPGTDAITIMAAVPTSTPALAATPTSLQFAYTSGGAVPAAQIVAISNSGTGTLAWTATSDQSWLTVSAASGTAPSSLSVSVSPAALTAGTYSGNVTITASGATNSPVTITVALTVTASTPTATLAVTPASLTFNYAVGSATPAAQTVSIANSGSGTLTWTAVSSAFWITVSPASGTAPSSLSVTANPANLAAGTYTGNLTITAAGATGSPASVTVTLVVQGTQPAGIISNVTNAASFQPSFASAEWVSIFGSNLSTSTVEWGSADIVNGILPTSLDGVSVTINGIPAYVEYISPTQINVLAPDDSATGSVNIQVTAAGQKSNVFAAQKQQYAPAFFAFDSGKYVAAEHSDYTYLNTASPAKPGETVLLYGTGFGPTSPPTPTGQLVSTAAPLPDGAVQITIGGVAATVVFAGLAASGEHQFNVTVPTLPSGDAAVVATIGGVQTQTGISIPIQ